MSTLVLIPARAGSAGVSRKSLQLVAGEPLVAHAIDLAQAFAHLRSETRGEHVGVLVSTDCPHIKGLAHRYGVQALDRPPELAGGDVPLIDVAAHAFKARPAADRLIMLEPTALGVTVADLTATVDTLDGPGQPSDYVSLVTEEHRQTWNHEGRITPYVNRQLRTMSNMLYTETGVSAMSRAHALGGSKTGNEMMALAQGEIVDVDSYEDLAIADLRSRRHLIWLRVIGAPETGTGHVQRCLRLADALRRIHDVAVDVIDGATWAQEMFTGRGLHPLGDRSPDVIVSDCLGAWDAEDHPSAPMVILEPASRLPDHVLVSTQYVVVDELAPAPTHGYMAGPRWAVLREEFAALPAQRKGYAEKMMRVVITCGGSDPGGLGQRIASHPALAGKDVRLIRGPAAAPLERPLAPPLYCFVENADMATELWEADLVICTRGRTQYEAGRAGAPMIVVAANGREQTHAILPRAHHLPAGLGDVALDVLLDLSLAQLAPRATREEAGRAGRAAVDDRGVERLVHLIDGMAQGLM